MTSNAHRIGAIFYALWGVLHVLGGGAILTTLLSDGGVAAQAMFGTALPASDLPTRSNTIVDGVMAYHSFNIIWFGIVVTIVALRLNWKNSVAGYWINLILVSLVDMGLFVTQVFPGRIAFADAMVGATLWIPAVIFSTFAIRRSGISSRAALRGVTTTPQGV